MSKLPLLSKSLPPPWAWEMGRGKTEEVVQEHPSPWGWLCGSGGSPGIFAAPFTGANHTAPAALQAKTSKNGATSRENFCISCRLFFISVGAVLISGYRCLAENLQSLPERMPLRKYLCGEGLRLWESTLGYPYQCAFAFPPSGAGTTISVKW